MCAVPNMAVFCSSLISRIPDTLLRYWLSDCEMIPVAPVITGITSFISHMRCIYIARSLYLFLYLYSMFLYLFYISQVLCSSHFCILKFKHVLKHTSLFIITDYDGQCTV
jgi:hypothetical protein